MWVISRRSSKKGTSFSIKDSNDKLLCDVREPTVALFLRSAPVMKKAVLNALQYSEHLPKSTVEELLLALGSPTSVEHKWVDSDQWTVQDMLYTIMRAAGLFPSISSNGKQIEISGNMKWKLGSAKHITGLVKSIQDQFKVSVNSSNKMGSVTYTAKVDNVPSLFHVPEKTPLGICVTREGAILRAVSYLFAVRLSTQKGHLLFTPDVEPLKSVKGVS